MQRLEYVLLLVLVRVSADVLDYVAIGERDSVRDAVLSRLNLQILVVIPTNLNLSRLGYRLHSITPLRFHTVFQTMLYTGDD